MSILYYQFFIYILALCSKLAHIYMTTLENEFYFKCKIIMIIHIIFKIPNN